MKTLYLKNSKTVSSLLDKHLDGEYWVTKGFKKHRVSIKKPGVKPGYPKDLAVSIQYPDGSVKSPTHRLLVSDFIKKREFSLKLSEVIYAQLEKLQNGEEPEVIKGEKGCPGLPANILIHALKWVWIQEDRNYPPPRKLGRRMNWSTYLLLHNGDADIKTPEGEKILKEHGYTDEEIETIRYRSRSRNLR